jgi:predicted MFS family arabinose efflux permease
VRGVADGAVAVALAAYLTHLGFSGGRIGLIVTCMLLGSAALTLLVGLRGYGLARRRLLQLAAITMIATGLVYATSTTFVVLIVVGVIGTLNPSGGDVSVFAPIEQSLLPSTTTDRGRTSMFARYAFVGSVFAAIGSLAAGVPALIANAFDADADSALRWVFVAYAVAGAVVLVVYRSLSPDIEPPPHQPSTPLGPSRPIVLKLAAVFSLDSFGGGFVVQSLLALWLYRRFDLSVPAAGALLFWMGLCSAVSAFWSARLASRIGLIRTMVFTHMPAQVFLVLAAFMPTLRLAIVFLLLRSLLSAMDVPARNSYVMAVVTPPERAAAASVTNVPRALASALPPVAAGWMLDHSTFGWPLVIAGCTKLAYDILLLVMFRHVRPPEEMPANIATTR